MFEPESLEFTDESTGKAYSLKIGRATARQGILRTYLREQERVKFLDENGQISTPDLESITFMVLSIMTYPDVTAAVISQTGFDRWPLTIEEFQNLPEEFVARWEEVAYRLNPHWVPTQGSLQVPSGIQTKST